MFILSRLAGQSPSHGHELSCVRSCRCRLFHCEPHLQVIVGHVCCFAIVSVMYIPTLPVRPD